jgi:hypothetical protein
LSRATDQLLNRCGRNQYGITSEDLPKRENIDNWSKLRAEFLETYKDRWLMLFSNLNKKQLWESLFSSSQNYRTPSLSSFYVEIREYSTIESYLLDFLLSRKDVALRKLGYSETEVSAIVREFNKEFYG